MEKLTLIKSFIFSLFLVLCICRPVIAEGQIQAKNKKDEIKDPFKYRQKTTQSKASTTKKTLSKYESLPAANASLANGIRVAAVVLRKDGAGIAALRLPEEESLVFVEKGDVLSIIPGGMKADKDPYYLLIKSVTKNGVEVAPKLRPKEIYILR